jgi:flagellar biosynthesis/type III secretory pathway protein FliH
MSQTSLEGSIREKSARLIAAIGEKEAAAIRRLDESCRAEIESFTRKAGVDTEARLRQELAKIDSRADLARRKLKLLGVDNFIGLIMDEVVRGLRHDPDYIQFVLNAVLDGVVHTSGEVEVRLKAEDLGLAPQIRAMVKIAESNREPAIREDAKIKWGGCLVVDVAGGRIFNYTIDRIYFRDTLMIRREIMKILLDNAAMQ